MKAAVMMVIAALLCAGNSLAENKPPATALDKLSYSAGYQLGDRFKKQKLNMMPEMVLKGLEDALYGRRLPLTKAEMKQILRDPKKYLAEDSLSRQAQ